jgi:hypothetical protein
MDKLLERAVGEGRVVNQGRPIATVRYAVRVYQQYVDAVTYEGSSRVPTLKRIECRIWGASIAQ